MREHRHDREQEYRGSFVLGCGSIGAIDNYVFYMDTADDWSRMKEPTDGVHIKEEAGASPTAVFNVTKVIDTPLTRYTLQAGKVSSFKLSRLIVPVGTIYQKWELK